MRTTTNTREKFLIAKNRLKTLKAEYRNRREYMDDDDRLRLRDLIEEAFDEYQDAKFALIN